VLITLIIITCFVQADKAKLPVRKIQDLKPAESSNEEILQLSESVIDATFHQAKDLISERRKRENLAGELLCLSNLKFK
jgi:hypothetical protein